MIPPLEGLREIAPVPELSKRHGVHPTNLWLDEAVLDQPGDRVRALWSALGVGEEEHSARRQSFIPCIGQLTVERDFLDRSARGRVSPSAGPWSRAWRVCRFAGICAPLNLSAFGCLSLRTGDQFRRSGLDESDLRFKRGGLILEGPPMWTNENRARYDRSHLRYPSDLTDDEWQLVEPLMRPGRRGGDKRTVIMREVVNGLMYILSTGCQWRAIPKDLPPRSTLYDYFDLWSWDRTLDLIHHELYVKCREAIGREASPTAAVIDSQSVKSAEKGGLRSICRATTQERRSRARSGIFSSIRKAC